MQPAESPLQGDDCRANQTSQACGLGFKKRPFRPENAGKAAKQKADCLRHFLIPAARLISSSLPCPIRIYADRRALRNGPSDRKMLEKPPHGTRIALDIFLFPLRA